MGPRALVTLQIFSPGQRMGSGLKKNKTKTSPRLSACSFSLSAPLHLPVALALPDFLTFAIYLSASVFLAASVAPLAPLPLSRALTLPPLSLSLIVACMRLCSGRGLSDACSVN